MFENGLLNLTNWAGNVIMPTLAGLFFAAAIYRFSKAHPYSHLSWAGFAALMCSGLLRALEAFAQQAGFSLTTVSSYTGPRNQIPVVDDQFPAPGSQVPPGSSIEAVVIYPSPHGHPPA